MIPLAKALKIVQRITPTLGAETCALTDALGRVLADDVSADRDDPPFDRSMMDGFAVKASDIVTTPVQLRIVGESAAGSGWHKNLGRGEAVRVMTGAPVPQGADTVQRVELTNSSFADDEEFVTILQPATKGMSVVKKGTEIRAGSRVLAKGESITPQNIAMLAAFGHSRVRVAKRPKVAIFGTGSEIVAFDKKPGIDQIRNSNSITLATLARSFGAVADVLENAKDDLDSLKKQIKVAAKGRDILITTGGVSVGKYDLTKSALDALGAEIFFEKVAIKPGKPVVAARLGKTLVFSLPGNPVSAAVTFHLFVRAAILQMQGAKETRPRTGFAILETPVKAAKDRRTLAAARLFANEAGQNVAVPIKGKGSSDLVSFAKANALIDIEMDTTAQAGSVVRVLYL